MTDKSQHDMVTVKVLKPIAQVVGPCLRFGQKAQFPRAAVDKFLRQGAVELWSDGISLVEAIKAVYEAGGRIDYDVDNAAMIQAFERIEAAEVPADDAEPEDESGSEPEVDAGNDGETDLNELTVNDLKALVNQAGKAVPRHATKAQLIELLK